MRHKSKKVKDTETAAEAVKVEDLKQKEQYKVLYEQSEAKAKAAEEKAEGLAESFLNVERDRAIEAHLVKEGINPKFLPMVKNFDKSKIIVETTDQGNINILGLESFSADLKTQYGEDLFPPADAPIINTDTVTKKIVVTKGQKLPAPEVLKLQREDPAAYKTYMEGLTGAS